MKYNVEKIKKSIDKYEYISFDIFDTLIKRETERPKDIFLIVEREFEKLFNKKIDNFYEKRISAEEEARSCDPKREPNIDDIYEHINLKNSEYDINAIKELEIKTEYSFCQRNMDFYEIYQYCVEKKKRIIITSDMYLKREHIATILENAGIDKYEELFISNEIKANKNTGEVYEYILKKLNIKRDEIIHIGDSFKADYFNARLHGIKSIKIQKKINKLKYFDIEKVEPKDKLDYSILESFINNNINVENGLYYNLGYEILGPLLYGYSIWLLDTLKKNNTDEILFLAREGHLLKKAFDIVNDSTINSKYIYVSRRSLRPALIEKTDELKEVYEIIKPKETTNVDKFLKDVGISYKSVKDLFEKKGYSSETILGDVKEMNSLFMELKEQIKKNAKLEKNNIVSYLQQEGIKKNIAISDVGWEGSMQNSICKIFPEYSVNGYYIATTVEQDDKLYYLDSYTKIRPFVHLFENLFLAQHGTTLKYEKSDDRYEPVLDKYEYSEKEQEIFKEIQNGALGFVKSFKNSSFNTYVRLNNRITSANVCKLGLEPRKEDIKLFEKNPYVETIKMNLIEAKGLGFYIFHLKQFKEDFYNSGWKIGFLKKVFKLDLPYYKLYNFLLKYKEK